MSQASSDASLKAGPNTSRGARSGDGAAAGKAPAADGRKMRLVRLWLYGVAALIVAMIVAG